MLRSILLSPVEGRIASHIVMAIQMAIEGQIFVAWEKLLLGNIAPRLPQSA